MIVWPSQGKFVDAGEIKSKYGASTLELVCAIAPLPLSLSSLSLSPSNSLSLHHWGDSKAKCRRDWIWFSCLWSIYDWCILAPYKFYIYLYVFMVRTCKQRLNWRKKWIVIRLKLHLLTRFLSWSQSFLRALKNWLAAPCIFFALTLKEKRRRFRLAAEIN